MDQTFGFVNAFKPPGPSSTAFGAWVRRKFAASAVGHWGTLDPRASGVLLLALGTATRLLPLITCTRKSYLCELVLGRRTDTGDASGSTLESAPPPDDATEKVHAALAGFLGEIEQTPPMHSAVKIAGRPLYERARRGLTVARAPRRVVIYGLRMLDASSGQTLRLAIDCSAGVYVRTLCEQIGARIGVPAHMGALLRTAAGPFSIDDAMLPSELARSPLRCVIDPLTILPQPRVAISSAQAERFVRGNPVDIANDRPASEMLVVHAGRLIGVGTANEDRAGRLFPTRVLVTAVV